MAFGSDASLLFRIKGDASDAIRAFNETKVAESELTAETAGMGGAFGALASPAGIATIAIGAATVAIGACVAAGISLSRTLIDITTQAADFGSSIKDASDKTGLGAQTLLALKTAAEQSGSSFEAVSNAVSKFNVLIGQANAGNAKAQKTLADYGITARDTQGALEQAVTAIAKMSNSTDQAAASAALFKDRTGEILPVIKSFNGDLPGLIQHLKDMGVTMTDEDMEAADALGDQMDTLKAQLQGVAFTLGKELFPVFKTVSEGISNWIAQNKGEIAALAKVIANLVAGAIASFTQLFNWLKENQTLVRVILAITSLGTSEFVRGVEGEILNALNEKGKSITGGLSAGISGGVSPTLGVGRGGGVPRSGGANQSDRDAREAAERAARELRANIEIELLNLRTQKDALVKELEDLRTKFAEDNNVTQFVEDVAKAFAKAKDNFAATLSYIEELERKQLAPDATQAEKDLLAAKQLERRNDLIKDGISLQNKNKDTVIKVTDALIEAWKKEGKAYADKVEAENDLERSRQDAMKETLQLTDAQHDAIDSMVDNITRGIIQDEHGGMFSGWLDSWSEFFDTVSTQVGDLGDSLTTFGGMLQDAFNGIANAIGNVVSNWILYGETGPAVMRKVLAAALASLAAEAVVWALKATALGFFYLAVGDFGSAALAFQSAAFWAAVAGVAAIAGRAVAGNSFKKTSGAANAAPAQSPQNQNTAGQGNYYSGYGNDPLVKEQGRTAPGLAEKSLRIIVQINDDSRAIGKLLKIGIENNQDVRRLIKSA